MPLRRGRGLHRRLESRAYDPLVGGQEGSSPSPGPEGFGDCRVLDSVLEDPLNGTCSGIDRELALLGGSEDKLHLAVVSSGGVKCFWRHRG